MFNNEPQPSILFIEGVYLSDCVVDPRHAVGVTADSVTTVKKKIFCNCLINEANSDCFVIASIEKKNGDYKYLKYGNETYCSYDCVKAVILKTHSRVGAYNFLAMIDFKISELRSRSE